MKNGIKLASLIVLLATTPFSYAEQPNEQSLGSTIDSFVGVIKDSAITTQIIAKIALDKLVSGVHVDITTHNGVVIITGGVNSDIEAKRIIELAQSTSGVKSVDANKLIVLKSDQPMADTAITTKIKGIFLKENLMGDKKIPAMEVHVETNNGYVFLTGTVDNPQYEKNAIELAKSVEGVKEVKSAIIVKTKS